MLLIASVAARLAWTYLAPNGANFVDLHVYSKNCQRAADLISHSAQTYAGAVLPASPGGRNAASSSRSELVRADVSLG